MKPFKEVKPGEIFGAKGLDNSTVKYIKLSNTDFRWGIRNPVVCVTTGYRLGTFTNDDEPVEVIGKVGLKSD